MKRKMIAVLLSLTMLVGTTQTAIASEVSFEEIEKEATFDVGQISDFTSAAPDETAAEASLFEEQGLQTDAPAFEEEEGATADFSASGTDFETDDALEVSFDDTTAQTEDNEESTFEGTVDSEGAQVNGLYWSQIKYKLGSNGALTISGSGSLGSPEDSMEDEAPWNPEDITSITISKGFTCIGRDVFTDYKNVEKVSLPAGLTEIGPYAFSGCSSLKTINLPDSVTRIGDGAFYGCSSLTSISIPKSLAYVDEESINEEEFPLGYLFWGCPLEKVINNNPHLTVVDGVVYNRAKTAVVLYPAANKSTSYTIPDTVTTLSDDAFLQCSYLQKIQLGKNVKTEISGWSFCFCNALEGFAVHPDNELYTAPGGVLYNKDMTELIAYPVGKSGTSYATAATCQKIRNGAFKESKLEEIGLTAGITELESRAFISTSVKKLTLPATLTKVDTEAFGSLRDHSNANKASYMPQLTDILYTGTEEQWNAIPYISVAMEVFGENPPTIQYGAAEATPSEEAAIEYNGDSGSGGQSGSGEESGGEESGEEGGEESSELTSKEITGQLSDGEEVTVSFQYTPSTTYDGRKHVISTNPAKNNAKVSETMAINPDIEFKNFVIRVDGTEIADALSSCKYKNNVKPGEMQIIPAVNWKNTNLKALSTQYKDLKKVLGSMLSPSQKYDSELEEKVWNYDPILVTIHQITLDSSTPVYNLYGMSKDEKAAVTAEDGVLVWSGKKVKIGWSTRKDSSWDEDDNGRPKKVTETSYIPTKVTVPGLYYQRVFTINGVPKVKKIALTAGGLSLKKTVYKEDGESYVEWSTSPAKGTYDYWLGEGGDADGMDKESKDSTTYIQPSLNTSGYTYTKVTTKKRYDKDLEDWDYYDIETEVTVAKPSIYFTGELPSFEETMKE